MRNQIPRLYLLLMVPIGINHKIRAIFVNHFIINKFRHTFNTCSLTSVFRYLNNKISSVSSSMYIRQVVPELPLYVR